MDIRDKFSSIPSLHGMPTAQGDTPEKIAEQKDIRKAATQFEALLVQQMLQSMWKTVPNEGLLTSNEERDFYRDMLSESLAKDISEGQGIGIKEVIMKDMNRLQNREKK